MKRNRHKFIKFVKKSFFLSRSILDRISKYPMLNFFHGYFLKEKRYQNSVIGIKFYNIDKPTD